MLQLVSAYGKLFDTTTFDPKSLNRIFRIGVVDKAVTTFFAPAFADLFKDSPNLSIEFRHPGQSYNRYLIRGDLDMGIFPNLTPEAGFHTHVLCEETMVLVVGTAHPLVELQAMRPLECSDFAPYRLIKVAHDMQIDYDEKWSTAVTSIPHVGNGDAAVWTPYFMSVPSMLDNSDFMSILPSHMAQQLVLRHRLHILGRPEHAPIFQPTLLARSDALRPGIAMVQGQNHFTMPRIQESVQDPGDPVLKFASVHFAKTAKGQLELQNHSLRKLQ
ncbi:MAG: LysR substrate-binding domain-containing protein [Sutterella seckii]